MVIVELKNLVISLLVHLSRPLNVLLKIVSIGAFTTSLGNESCDWKRKKRERFYALFFYAIFWQHHLTFISRSSFEDKSGNPILRSECMPKPQPFWTDQETCIIIMGIWTQRVDSTFCIDATCTSCKPI